MEISRVGNMGQFTLAQVLEGRAVKLVALIKFKPIGLARIGPAAHQEGRTSPNRPNYYYYFFFFF